MATRSAQLYGIDSSTTGGFTPVYTVPAGYTTIFKTLAAVNYTGVSDFLRVGIKTAGGLLIGLFDVEGAAARTVVNQTRWDVLNPGDGIYYLAGHAGWALLFSGAQLID